MPRREESLGNAQLALAGWLAPLHHQPEDPLPSLQPSPPTPLLFPASSGVTLTPPQPGPLLLSYQRPTAATVCAHGHQPMPPSLLCHHSEDRYFPLHAVMASSLRNGQGSPAVSWGGRRAACGCIFAAGQGMRDSCRAPSVFPPRRQL